MVSVATVSVTIMLSGEEMELMLSYSISKPSDEVSPANDRQLIIADVEPISYAARFTISGHGGICLSVISSM